MAVGGSASLSLPHDRHALCQLCLAADSAARHAAAPIQLQTNKNTTAAMAASFCLPHTLSLSSSAVPVPPSMGAWC
ncbi:hypothetical protein E2562_021666 [Oryza meyeriana var. granulata]|uniref:Uncharacterized protein n=1 Tax=Oryza meyeriana var. granulata TaxID=110450 RepID=A0A6G1DZJ7_9ORYZ|nr:hypothetical protein E2562_021666 [Oryza meyeriana var. granulata]